MIAKLTVNRPAVKEEHRMNKQFKIVDGKKVNSKIEWCDYTWNPVQGCFHACQWTMPDGSVANCYAEDVAERGVASANYPEGFEYHYWKPERLIAPAKVKEPSKIFVGSMADVFGHWVPDEQIYAILDVPQTKAQHHTYQFLTKNPKRYLSHFDFTHNCWMGVSTPPDFMWNKPLSIPQKERMLRVTLETFDQMDDEPLTWLSAEPLSWDIVPILEDHPYAFDWIVIGAASNGKQYYPPDAWHVDKLVDYCDNLGISVFFKGNLKSLPWARENWREDFPGTVPATNKQLPLL